MNILDDASRFDQLTATIQEKGGLRKLYLEVYEKYKACMTRCPQVGLALELGSGGGFVKEVIPEMLTSDVIHYHGVDHVVDGTKMNFSDGELKFIGMNNVLHHIPDAEKFFQEVSRVLNKGGRIFILDPYLGYLSKFIYQHSHHEPCNPHAKEWKFESSGPLSDANIALAWIIFERDIELFKKKFPELKIIRYEPHSPLRYWLSGGLKKWSLLPGFLFPLATWIDRLLISISPHWASFVDIEIEKIVVNEMEKND